MIIISITVNLWKKILVTRIVFYNPLLIFNTNKNYKTCNIFESNINSIDKEFIKLNYCLNNILNEERINYKLKLRKIKLNYYINNIRFGLEKIN